MNKLLIKSSVWLRNVVDNIEKIVLKKTALQKKVQWNEWSRIENFIKKFIRDKPRKTLLFNYSTNIKQGSTELCTCCGGLWSPNQIKLLKKNLSTFTEQVFLVPKFSNDSDNFVQTCEIKLYYWLSYQHFEKFRKR